MKNLVKQASDELRQLLMEALARAVAKELLPAEALPDFTIEIPADEDVSSSSPLHLTVSMFTSTLQSLMILSNSGRL